MLEPFQLPFVQRGILQILLLAVAGGLLGTWIVLRGLAFYAHAVAAASYSVGRLGGQSSYAGRAELETWTVEEGATTA